MNINLKIFLGVGTNAKLYLRNDWANGHAGQGCTSIMYHFIKVQIEVGRGEVQTIRKVK